MNQKAVLWLSPFFFISILSIAIGTALCGYFISRGIAQFRTQGRFVTVKGLAEREVNADLAIWKIRFKASGNDLAKTNQKIKSDIKAIMEFLRKNGLNANEIEFTAPRVIDLFAREFGPEKLPPNRYIIDAMIIVRTTEVDRIKKASEDAIELVQLGVVLDEGNYGANPSYIFTRLNELRPGMLAEATKSARTLAEQFAADSFSKVGPIKQANQGTFTISSYTQADTEGNDEKLTARKRVRVVTTIDYFLLE